MTVRPSKYEDFSDVWSIGEMDGVWGLDLDSSITRSFRGYGKCSVGHGVEHGNDFTDRIVSRRDCHFLVIGVCDQHWS